MDKYSAILCDERLLSCAAYYFCRDAGLDKRYPMKEPQPELIERLVQTGVLEASGHSLTDARFGYACYEYYRQSYRPDAFDKLLLKEAEGKASILDLCCGSGATVLALLDSSADRKIYAVDRDPFALSLLRSVLAYRHADPEAAIVQAADAHAVGAADQSIDFIVCRAALQYLQVPAALKEMHRVLRHGGKVFVVVHGPGYMPDYLFVRRRLFAMSGTMNVSGGAKGAKFLTFGSLRTMLAEAGFDSIHYVEEREWMFAGILPIYFGIVAEKRQR